MIRKVRPKLADLKIEVNDQLVKNASQLFEDMGLDLPTAIRLFLEKSIEDETCPLTTHIMQILSKPLMMLRKAI